MNQISLHWTHARSTPLYTLEARGLSHAQLRYYAQRVGFQSYTDDEDYLILIGAGAELKLDLLCLLESAGYEVEEFSR